MTKSSLSDEQRQDLAILAGGDADEITSSRARLLLADNKEAVTYFSAMQRMTRMLDAELSGDQAAGASEFLPDDQVKVLAGQIRRRASRRHWIRRSWAIAASILIILGSAVALSRPLFKSRELATVHLFPLPFGLSGAGADRWRQLRESEVLTTTREIGLIVLPGQKVIVVDSYSSIRWEQQAIHVLYGQCYVRAADFVVSAGESRLHVAGELLVSVESGDGSFVDVYSGTAAFDAPSEHVVQSGQHATLNPFQVTTMTLVRPAWVKSALERLKDIK